MNSSNPGNYFVFDIETTSVKITSDFLCGGILFVKPAEESSEEIQFGKVFYTDFEKFFTAFLNSFQMAPCVGHNVVSFDLPCIAYNEKKHLGTDYLLSLLKHNLRDREPRDEDHTKQWLYHEIYDTLVLSRRLWPTRQSHSLEWWGRHLQVPKVEVPDWKTASPELIKKRCLTDCDITQKAMAEIMDCGIENVADHRSDQYLYSIIIEILAMGLPYDKLLAESMASKLYAKTIVPSNILAREAPGVNFNSGKQFTKWAEARGVERLPRTPTGNVALNADTRDEMCQKIPLLHNHFIVKDTMGQIKYISDKYSKKSDKIYFGNHTAMNPYFNHTAVYPSFSFVGTRTGRGQYSEPAIQQTSKGIRSVIAAPRGYLWVGMDLVALELSWWGYLAKELTGNTTVWREVTEGKSMKLRTLEVFEPIMHSVVLHGGQTKEDLAKTLTYSCLYGIGRTALCKKLNLPESEENKMRIAECLEKRFPGLRELKEVMEYRMRGREYIEDYFGRQVVTSEWKSLNAFVQSSASSYALKMIFLFRSAINNLKVKSYAVLYQMDEVGLLVKHDNKAEAKEWANSCAREAERELESVWNCPLIAKCNVKVGNSWAEGH